MWLIDEVTRFEPQGGPKGIGYLEAAAHVPVDAWFYSGHFLNDSCMPGTLMADAAVQCLSFLMAAMGMTVKHDGWRFEPVTEEAFKFVCRGQVIPDRAHELRYEVFVTEIVDGPEPTVFATLLCTSDGLKVFHCPRFGLKLVPDWPLSTRQQWLDGAEPPRILREDGDVRGDFTAIMACAWDRPSIPFGSGYAPFDGKGRVPRLPGPPYLFISRINEVSGPAWKGETGITVTAEYDVPPDAWYFAENDRPTMPFCVLGETLLQPCGWLASYTGFALSGTAYFRNLDGSDSVQSIEVTPDIGTLTTKATLTRVVRLGALTLVFFAVECKAGDRLVAVMSTSFGFFGETELAQQAGLPANPEAKARLTEPFDREHRPPHRTGRILRRAASAAGREAPHDRRGHRLLAGRGRRAGAHPHPAGDQSAFLVLQGALLRRSGAARHARTRGAAPGGEVLPDPFRRGAKPAGAAFRADRARRGARSGSIAARSCRGTRRW